MSDVQAEKIARGTHIWPRASLEWYVEPRRVSTALFAAERFVGTIWDPCAGGGNILESAIDAGYPVVGTDLVDRSSRFWFREVADFTTWDRQPLGQNIVFNAPFYRGAGTEAFIRKALSLAVGKVCAFVDMRFLQSAGRANGLYTEHCPHRCWIITPRPSCPPGEYLAAGNKASGGTPDFVWLVWSLTDPPANGMMTDWLNAPEPKFDIAAEAG